METVRAALSDRDFSSQAMEGILRARKRSTLKVYEGKWKVFCQWCLEKKVDPIKASIPKLADFFIFLFREKKMAPITIKGYRSMISDTYKHYGRDSIGLDKALSDLMSNFDLEKPKHRSLVPSWNLTIVLNWLQRKEFEPLEAASLSCLTKKTCFLLALATASRVSEIHALSVDQACLQFRDDGSVSLTTAPGFVAKNRL